MILQSRLRAHFERLKRTDPQERRWILIGLTQPLLRALGQAWWLWAHDGQDAPEGNWRVWLIRAGRGFGKTRAGAEWVSQIARDVPGARIALVAATLDEAERVMVKGESGLLNVAAINETPIWSATTRQVHFSSGAIGYVYSAASPDALRGPQHHAAWCDELAKWRYGQATWDNLTMGLRLGDGPRIVVTTTPRPVPLLKAIMALPDVRQTTGTTYHNKHLPESFVAAMTATYGGSRLGRQELEGELIEDHEGALWTRAMLEAARIAADGVPVLSRVVVAVDPPAGETGDACGIVAAGLDADGTGYVLEDASVAGASPERWAAAVAACAARHEADRVVAEKNQGGSMVESVLRAADTALPVKLVHASRGKVARAEPVAALYERGKVKHAGAFDALEDELCGLVTGGGAYAGPGRSPDRADALVWALTELMLGRKSKAGVRIV